MTIQHAMTREFCERFRKNMKHHPKGAKKKRKKAVPADERQPRHTIPLLLDHEMLITPTNPLPVLVLRAQVEG